MVISYAGSDEQLYSGVSSVGSYETRVTGILWYPTSMPNIHTHVKVYKLIRNIN